MGTLYDVLGVSDTATRDEIVKAYRLLMFKVHPDTGNGDAAKLQAVRDAYKVLCDKAKRKHYDAILRVLQNNVQQTQQTQQQNNPSWSFFSSGSMSSMGYASARQYGAAYMQSPVIQSPYLPQNLNDMIGSDVYAQIGSQQVLIGQIAGIQVSQSPSTYTRIEYTVRAIIP